MPNEIDRTSSAQRRSSRLLTAMAIFICLGIAAYMVLTLLVNRQTPATPAFLTKKRQPPESLRKSCRS